jgi:hypothetical protein
MITKPNPWTTIEEMASDKEGHKKFRATIVPINAIQDKTGEWVSLRCVKDKDIYRMQNTRICLEVGKEQAKILNNLGEKTIVENERIWIGEYDKNYKLLKEYGLYGGDVSVKLEGDEKQSVLTRTIEFKDDCIIIHKYILGENAPLKYSVNFQSLKKEKRKIKIYVVRKGIEGDRFIALETSPKDEQMVSPETKPPFMVYAWGLSIKDKDSTLLTDELYNEFENGSLRPILIDLEDGKLKVEIGFEFDVEPLGTATLDPTTYTNTITGAYDGTVIGTTDAYGNTSWLLDTTSGGLKWGVGSTYYQRGFAQFNISSMPTWAMISYCSFKYHGFTSSARTTLIRSLQNSVTGQGAQTIWTYITDATTMISVANFPVVATNQEISLGATGISELQNKLTGGWFGLGFKDSTETTTSGRVIYSSVNASANPKPTLYIEYYLFGTEMGAAEYGALEIH